MFVSSLALLSEELPARAYRCSFSSRLPTSMTLPLPGLGRCPLPDTPARHPTRCRVVGIAPTRLDPYRAGRGGGGALESQRQRNRSCLPPTWTAEDEGLRTSIERFFGRVFSLFSFFRVPRPKLEWLVGSSDTRGLDVSKPEFNFINKSYYLSSNI
jgi:hypothetical protein